MIKSVAGASGGMRQLDDQAYRTLADFRYLLRRFLAFSENAARGAGLTPRQHQALLAIKGFAGDAAPTIGDLAARLSIRPHSAVELAGRLAEAGLVTRIADPHDRRRVLLRLTETAEARLAALSLAHIDELAAIRPALLEILRLVGAPSAPD
ncbi:MAG TPA: MarR family winged helix-turn-helix transcriptional regulator [Stellaceae bacterium]|nr:MarR family winged helix-turn-helix transcriptional regulator [Stellaceae bacterium]